VRDEYPERNREKRAACLREPRAGLREHATFLPLPGQQMVRTRERERMISGRAGHISRLNGRAGLHCADSSQKWLQIARGLARLLHKPVLVEGSARVGWMPATSYTRAGISEQGAVEQARVAARVAEGAEQKARRPLDLAPASKSKVLCPERARLRSGFVPARCAGAKYQPIQQQVPVCRRVSALALVPQGPAVTGAIDR
jgi:hypothetical protein